MMQDLTAWLSGLGDVGKVPLASILGAMTAFDMGGPINKVATLFAQTQVDTLPYLMGGVGVAICTPPIGMGIATLLAPQEVQCGREGSRQGGYSDGLRGHH